MMKSRIVDTAVSSGKPHARIRRTAGLAAGALAACALVAFPLVGCQSTDTAAPEPQRAGQSAEPAAPEPQQNGQTAIDSTKMRGAAEGHPAPEAPLAMLDGSTKNISDFQGNVTILSFWATWCPYCIKEMPDLQKVKENYPDTNVVLVNCGEEAAVVADFAEQKGYDFVWALDENFDAQRAYPTSGIPYTVVIDAQGTVSEIFAGSGPDMYSKFEEAVKKASAA